MDGVDVALIETDGENLVHTLATAEVGYGDAFRARLRATLGEKGDVGEVERGLTLIHVEAVKSLLDAENVRADDIDLIGFHGQTILHQPEIGLTRQIGDGALLARECGIPVVNDFRSNDMAAGGEGAPFAPAYHRALASGLAMPVAVLNIGGVGNVTWIGEDDDAFLAFDTGPGNALVDDWVLKHTGATMDEGGKIAASGRVDQDRLNQLMQHPYFAKQPPKSLDRDDFAERTGPIVDGLPIADGAALLTAFTAASIAKSAEYFPAPVKSWIVTGGGRLNPTLLAELRARTGDALVQTAEDVGWNGSSLEAEAFAYLAVRSRLGLPLSYPGTTGVPSPTTGGAYNDLQG